MEDFNFRILSQKLNICIQCRSMLVLGIPGSIVLEQNLFKICLLQQRERNWGNWVFLDWQKLLILYTGLSHYHSKLSLVNKQMRGTWFKKHSRCKQAKLLSYFHRLKISSGLEKLQHVYHVYRHTSVNFMWLYEEYDFKQHLMMWFCTSQRIHYLLWC